MGEKHCGTQMEVSLFWFVASEVSTVHGVLAPQLCSVRRQVIMEGVCGKQDLLMSWETLFNVWAFEEHSTSKIRNVSISKSVQRLPQRELGTIVTKKAHKDGGATLQGTELL